MKFAPFDTFSRLRMAMAPADGRDPDQLLKKADRSGHSWTGKSSSRKPGRFVATS